LRHAVPAFEAVEVGLGLLVCIEGNFFAEVAQDFLESEGGSEAVAIGAVGLEDENGAGGRDGFAELFDV
jgi:hypothetical protein